MTQRHNFKCPKCQSTSRINILIECWACITDDGTDTSQPQDGSHFFDGDSTVCCEGCGYASNAANFLPNTESDYWTDIPVSGAKDPMNDDDYTGNEEQIADLKALVEELRATRPT
jgi:hypothetical protein